MKTDFQASGYPFFHFLRQQSIATSRSSFKFNQNILETWERGFLSVFCLLFYSEFFFCKWKLLLKLGGSQVFKELYSCQWTPIFSILQIFFKVEAAFPYSGNLFFNILHPDSANGFSFCLAETVFFGQCFFTASTNHYGIRRKQF